MNKPLKGFFGVTHRDVHRIIRWRKRFQRAEQEIRRVIALDPEDGSPILEPPGNKSWVVYGGAGSGKSIGVAIPAVQSLLWDISRGILINDVKSGEIAHQIARMCLKAGRRFAVIDPHYQMGADYPYRISVNPLGNIVLAFLRDSPDLLAEIETAVNTILPEPEGGKDKNFFFREVPREIIAYAILAMLTRDVSLATPGGITETIVDPHNLYTAVDNDAEDGGVLTRSRAKQIQEMRNNDPEHFSQHVLAAASALKSFMPGNPLAETGSDEDITAESLLQKNYIVLSVGSPKTAMRSGVYSGLIFNSFLSAALSGECGRNDLILDEAANTPAKEIIEKVTIFRAYGFRVLYIAQSRSDLIRQNGEKIIQTLEDNTNIQWLQFANFDEAERVSRAIGDVENVSFSLGGNPGNPNFSTNFQTGRERKFTPDELLNMPADMQMQYVSGVGFLYNRKIRANQIAPMCFDLDPNPYEGGRLEPDVKIDLRDYFRGPR